MLKKILSLIISATVLATACIPLGISAESTDTAETKAPVIMMNGEALTENEPQKYIYTVESLNDIPILTCDFDSTKYSALISQPERNNGYTGTVILTSIEDGSVTEYTVNVYDQNTFQSHFINLGGDPWVTYHDGWYYYMYTGNGFFISRSRELERVNSNPVSVFNISDLADNENFSIVKELWAPELHFIDGRWYIYFTAYDGEAEDDTAWNGCTGTPSNHRMYVLESENEDAFSAYTFKGQLKEVEADYINDADRATVGYNIKDGHWAIDQSIFEWNGKLYAIWSGWSGYKSIDQRIYIAEMSNPYTISGNRVELSRPEYGYEIYSMIPAINEAPQALISPDGSTLNIAFSVNRFDDSHYSLGLLTLKADGDPLNAEDWIKTDEPVFETNQKNSTYSVGHCSFVPSPDNSEYYVIYHARRGEDTDIYPREIRVQQFYWNSDGTPSFDKAINAADLVEIPSGTAIIDRTKIEAENAALSGGAVIASATDGSTTYDADYYSGGKHLKLTAAGSAATFTYTAEKAGKYTISLLAAGSHSTASGFTVTVNGTEYKRRLGGNASNINNFCYYDLSGVELNEGENTIAVSHILAFSRGGYLDRIDIWNEADAESITAAQDAANLVTDKTPVIRTVYPYTSEKTPEYNKEYTFNDFGDFDKYWFSTEPFVDDPEYENVITTCRAGGNKRLLVTGEEFKSIADFSASVEIIPAAAHDNAHNPAFPVVDETGINSGILFRIGKMLDYNTNVCTFDGYRCFITAESGKVKLQLSRYYFKEETSASSTNQVLKTADQALTYTPGDTYILEVSCIGNTVNAKAYNKNDPTTVITISNQTIVTSVADTLDSGRIGLFVNCGSRVTFANMKLTPYFSAATEQAVSDYGKLNDLSSYTAYTTSTSNVHSVTDSVISNPANTSKLILNDSTAQNVKNFTASAKIKLTAANSAIQAGFAFRMSDVVASSPGLTGYAVFLQRTSTRNMNEMVINLTKYGTKGTSKNVNLGNQSWVDKTLLSDITDKADITGLEFHFKATAIDNKLTVKVSRADKPELYSVHNWILDDTAYTVNKNYPVYYESGMLGIFSHGTSKYSNISFNILDAVDYDISLPNASEISGGNAATDIITATSGRAVKLTLSAGENYYLDTEKLSVVLEDGSTVAINNNKAYWDTAGVYSFTMPQGTVSINYGFSPIAEGDANKDGTADVRDLIRTKKYLAQLTDDIGLSNTDTDNDKSINADDLTSIRKNLLNK